MPWPVHPNGLLGAQGDNDNYQISRSLRFNSGDSAYLNRTPGSAGDRRKFTISMWIKRGKFGSDVSPIFAWPGGNTLSFNIVFNTSNQLEVIANIEGIANQYRLQTTQVFRDPSAWYHLVVASDTAQATASDRVSVYINGSKITSFGIATYPTILFENSWNNTVLNGIGYNNYFDGYLTEIYNIDGQALTPSSFGETDAITGRWKAKAFSGNYGTNGFYLKFADNSSTAALGTDSSGNGNTWTTNNFSVTAGAGNDSLVDSPTNYGSDTGAGGTLRGNYCTLNPLDKVDSTYTLPSITNGNLDVSTNVAGSSVNGSGFTFSNTPITGKWYYEILVNNISVGSTGYLYFSIGSSYIWWSYGATYQIVGSTGTTSISLINNGDIIQIAVDSDSGKVWYGKNNTWYTTSGVPSPSSGTGAAHSFTQSALQYISIQGRTGSSAQNCSFNFGQRPFAYTAPTGFKALCTTNLTTPTIKKPSSYFDAVAYTGTGASNSISSLGFSPDLVWIKNRGGATSHSIYDTTRGTGSQLSSDTTGDQVTSSSGLTAFGSNGFTISTSTLVNTSGTQYVAWAWDEAPIAGMDIVDYTGNGANRTIAHTLGVAPKMLIVKARTTAGADQGWPVWHTSIANTTYLELNSTSATASGTNYWNSTSPTSSVFSVGTNAAVNTSADTYIAYAFAEVEGFSKFGSYTGNGSADGPFVYCGFRPRWILVKNSSAVATWFTWDTARGIYNVDGSTLSPNVSAAEDVNNSLLYIDELSNGFKIRSSYSGINTSSNTYIFAAFAEAPFKYARAR